MDMSENEDSDNYKFIPTIETFDSILNNINQNTALNQINQSLDEEKISTKKTFSDDKIISKETCSCSPKNILYRISDIIILIFMVFDAIFYFIANILRIVEYTISYYSVIIMNYVFFISSIISYSMAPVYKSLSEDWLNFAVSFLQVILASPLIAFYILYIIKSIKNLGEFVTNTPNVINNFITMYRIEFKGDFLRFISMFPKRDYEKIFDKRISYFIVINSFASLIMMSCYVVLGYVLFCLDKCIIIIGILCYAINTLQIFLLVIPSYLYLIQTLFNIKCKRIRYVNAMINLYKMLMKSEESKEKDDESKPNKEESKEKDKKLNESKQDSEEFDSYESSLNESTFANSSQNEKQSNNMSSMQLLQMKVRYYFHRFISLFEEEDDDDDGKIINDEYIEELEDDETKYNNTFKEMVKMVRELVLAHNYVSLYYFSTEIAFDKHKQNRKRFCMLIFLILNLGIIIYDIVQLSKDYSDYLLSSIIVRFILVPLFSYYNIVTVLYHKAKDKTIRYVNIASVIITVLIIIIIIFGFSYNSIYKTKYRIKNLEYYPPLNNITIANPNALIHPICDLNIFGVSSFDAFGYALGGFDIKRDHTIFDNQMKTFFGSKYSNHISYKIYELDKYFQFLKFYDSSINTTIFAFRGYNSGPEIAFQFELFASHYIIPFFEDNTPFLGLINDYWLGFYTDFLHAFGLRFFENRNLMVKYVKLIREIYDKENYSEIENIIFTGINTGGVIAKIVGTLSNKRSISFISFPMAMDFLEHLFQFSQTYMSYVTNVFNVDGIFSQPDSDHTINIGIDTPLFHQTKYCTSGFCDIFSRVDNIYRTFCTMSETCGRGNQFNYYCLNTIGKKNLETIREGLRETD